MRYNYIIRSYFFDEYRTLFVISNTPILYIFFNAVSDAFYPFKSSAIIINIFAALICIWAFLYNSTKSILFLFLLIYLLLNWLSKSSFLIKLFFSAYSTEKFHLFMNTKVSLTNGLLHITMSKLHLSTLSREPYFSNIYHSQR